MGEAAEEPFLRQPRLALEDSPQSDVWRTELLREVKLLIGGERLAAPYEYCVLIHGGIQGAEIGIRQRLRQAEAARFGTEARRIPDRELKKASWRLPTLPA